MEATRDERRAAYAALADAFACLPQATRATMIAEFKAERARNPVMRWGSYLEAILPLVPPEAR